MLDFDGVVEFLGVYFFCLEVWAVLTGADVAKLDGLMKFLISLAGMIGAIFSVITGEVGLEVN